MNRSIWVFLNKFPLKACNPGNIFYNRIKPRHDNILGAEWHETMHVKVSAKVRQRLKLGDGFLTFLLHGVILVKGGQ